MHMGVRVPHPHTHARTHRQAHARSHMRTHSHTHTHTQWRKHTDTHTHTQTPTNMHARGPKGGERLALEWDRGRVFDEDLAGLMALNVKDARGLKVGGGR